MDSKKEDTKMARKKAVITASDEAADYEEADPKTSPNAERYGKMFRDRLGIFRSQMGVTETEMSEEIGMSPGYIAGLSSGRNLPRMGVFFRMADYLEVTPRDFFDEGEPVSELTKELQRECAKLNPKIQKQILGLVKEINESNGKQ